MLGWPVCVCMCVCMCVCVEGDLLTDLNQRLVTHTHTYTYTQTTGMTLHVLGLHDVLHVLLLQVELLL